MKILTVIIALISMFSNMALAELKLTCREPMANHQVLIQVFRFHGASRDVEQTQKLTVFAYKAKAKAYGSPTTSVSNNSQSANTILENKTYQVVKATSSSSNDSNIVHLEGGGLVMFNFDATKQMWNGHFVRPYGPEFPRILKNCDLTNPDVGFTGHN